MNDFISRFERQLVAARRPRLLQIRRPVMLGAIGIVLVAGTATAAIVPWTPDLGRDHPREFAIARTQAPAAQRDALSVLRRSQTDVDRGEQAAYALRFFGANAGSVRTDSVRVLRAGNDQGAAVLIPVTAYRPAQGSHPGSDAPPTATTAPDGLCLFVRDAVDGGAQRCYSLEELLSGAIRGALSDQRGVLIYGLVPDPTTAVRIHYGDGRASTVVPVRDNFYSYEFGATPEGARFNAVEWLDASGNVLRTQEGMSIVPPGSAPMLRDCGDGRFLRQRAGESDVCRRSHGG